MKEKVETIDGHRVRIILGAQLEEISLTPTPRETTTCAYITRPTSTLLEDARRNAFATDAAGAKFAGVLAELSAALTKH